MLCPLDKELPLRIWYSEEPICRSRKHGSHRWIKKQRSIQRRKTKSWFDKPVTYQMLYDASRPMKLNNKQRRQRAERIKKLRGQQTIKDAA